MVSPAAAAVVTEGDEQQDAEEYQAGDAEKFGELRCVADAHEDPGDEGRLGAGDGESNYHGSFTEIEGGDLGGNGSTDNQGDENLDQCTDFRNVRVMVFFYF